MEVWEIGAYFLVALFGVMALLAAVSFFSGRGVAIGEFWKESESSRVLLVRVLNSILLALITILLALILWRIW